MLVSGQPKGSQVREKYFPENFLAAEVRRSTLAEKRRFVHDQTRHFEFTGVSPRQKMRAHLFEECPGGPLREGKNPEKMFNVSAYTVECWYQDNKRRRRFVRN